jgi:hypothetical protein
VDLSYHRFETEATASPLAADLALLLVAAVARQAASPTARLQWRIMRPAPRLGPLLQPQGAFHRETALRLAQWLEA